MLVQFLYKVNLMKGYIWCNIKIYYIIFFNTDVKTDSSTKSDSVANAGLIAGIAAALVLLLALILIALYINHHPNAASPLYLIQVSIRYVLHPSWKEPGGL